MAARSEEKSRRSFLKGTVARGVVATGLLPQVAHTQQAARQNDVAAIDRLQRARKVLLKGGIVMSLDLAVGDFAKADVLIEGKKISAIASDLSAAAQGAVTVDATDMIVMPGFVDTHHHQYETVLRSLLADGNLGVFNDAPKNYMSVIQQILTPAYKPEDAYISELVASLSQLNAGVTTTIDLSQVSHTPAHSDACIQGLKESGRRAVYSYSAGITGTAFPQDITRIKTQYFSSNDQLLTLALNTGTNADHWRLARSVGVPITSHIVGDRFGSLEDMGKKGLMGPDNEYVHCTQLNETVWKMIQETGGKVSIAPAIEMQMRHGMPPFQKALDHGIRPSLSVDVECNMSADMFTIMRSAFTLQRALVNERAVNGEKDLPKLLTCRDVIEMATVEGARVAHLDSQIGTLTPGKEADITMLATDRVNVFPMNNVPGTVVTMMDTSSVENVFVAGQVRKWRGRLVGVDLARIRRQIEQARDGLLARANYKKDMFGSCCAVS
jgi:cytosine/adenosine deaminase-related metal-dependent hydrolase